MALSNKASYWPIQNMAQISKDLIEFFISIDSYFATGSVKKTQMYLLSVELYILIKERFLAVLNEGGKKTISDQRQKCVISQNSK